MSLDTQIEPIVALDEAIMFFRENTDYRVVPQQIGPRGETIYLLEHSHISSYSFRVKSADELIRYANIRKRLGVKH